MKKVLLLSVCLIVSVLFGGGKSWASVTTETSDGNNTLTIKLEGTATDADVSSVKNAMQNCSYTKVVVTGGTITDAFVQAILYADYGGNGSITTLDLSGTSYNATTFPKSVFTPSSNEYRKGQLKVATLSLPNNIITIGEEAVQLTELKELILPSSLTTIGKKGFMNNNKLESVTFPENLDKIDDAAFANCPIKNLKFNSKLRFIGNSAFACNSSIHEETLIIPASVKYIGPSAFCGHEYQDVYFQGDKAPIMPSGASVCNDLTWLDAKYNTAFPSNTLNGNNGFTPNGGQSTHDNANEGWANRDNYYNNGYYFCILHYPTNLSEENKNTYVDVTRKYITKTEGTFSYGETYAEGKETTALGQVGTCTANTNVGYGYKDTYLGEQYIWPSQGQWNRAFVTAALGLCWNGVDTYRPTLTQEEKDIYAEAGYVIDDGEGQYTEEELSKMAHMGTRMFVLANPDAQKDKYNPGNIKKDGTWWTICVPFNMTKKQVLETFGDKTQLCLFNEVTRQIDPDGKKHLLIRFATNPMEHKTSYENGTKAKFTESVDASEANGHVAGEWDYKTIAGSDVVNTPADDDIVIWAHESYMIKPDDGENSDKDPVTIVNYEPVPGNPLPSVVRAKTTTTKNGQSADDYENCYRFVGNYLSDAMMPQYSYFFGTGSNGDKTEKFRFYTGTSSKWKTNKCLIEVAAHEGGYEDYTNFFNSDVTNAKVTSNTVFGFDDKNGDTTAIDDVQIQVGNDVLTPIFSLDGKMVSLSGDTTGLAKGVYVKAGKKFIVR